MPDVVAVGGGIAGLSTALALRDAGFQGGLTLLERDGRWGGKIRTERIGDYLLEGGPEAILSQKPWGLELARRLGLSDRLLKTRQENSGVFVWSQGRLQSVPEGFTLMVPTRIGPFLRTGLLSPWGKLRMGLDWFIPPRKAVDDESLGAFVRRRLGSEVLEKIAEPMMAGIYAADADRLSLQCTFPRFIDMEQRHGSLVRAALTGKTPVSDPSLTPFMSFKGGLQELVDALSAELQRQGVVLRHGVDVLQVTPGEVRLADGEVLKADAIVLATPAFDTARLLRDVDASLADHLDRLVYETAATVTAAWPRQSVRHSLRGFGFVVPRKERKQILACTWTSSKWSLRAPDGIAMLRAYTAGGDLHQQSDDDLKAHVLDELKGMVGTEGPPLMVEVRRLARSTPHYLVGHLDWVAKAESMTAVHRGLFITGSAYRGVGIPDCIHEGTLVAESVVRFLSQV